MLTKGAITIVDLYVAMLVHPISLLDFKTEVDPNIVKVGDLLLNYPK
jgi:hypothetical protein